jgi:hypothetical protein
MGTLKPPVAEELVERRSPMDKADHRRIGDVVEIEGPASPRCCHCADLDDQPLAYPVGYLVSTGVFVCGLENIVSKVANCEELTSDPLEILCYLDAVCFLRDLLAVE